MQVIPDRIQHNPEMHYQDYSASLDLTHALLFAIAMGILNFEPCQSDYFLFCLVRSQTMISAIARFALIYIGKERVQRFIITQTAILPGDRAISLMFYVIPELAVDLALTTQFHFENSWSHNTNLSSCFIAMTNLGRAFECLLFCKLDSWLAILILDDSPLTRFNAIILIANILRTDRFGEKYRRPSTWIRTEDNKSTTRASHILAKLVTIAPELAQRITHDITRNVEEHRADAYLHTLSVLIRFASMIPPLQPLNILYQTLCITQKNPFNRQCTACLQILADKRF
jgi:hypothetical protein